MKFTLNEAKEFAEKKKIDKWAIKFLLETNNKNFANFVKNKGYWIGLNEIKLAKLNRRCGPEKEMKHREKLSIWNKRVNGMIKDIKTGWDVPPLIVWFLNNELSIADGSHRLEALRKSGFNKYWVAIWFDKYEDYKQYSNL